MDKTSILIVEDEGIVAINLSRKLGQLGYEVTGTAKNAQEAFDMALELRPQLILMDIQLSGQRDGIQAAEAVRAQYDVPVIYLTAHSDPATLARAKLTGPFGYVLKPFEMRDLATQIELALYKHQVDKQVHEQREWLRVTLTSIGDAVITTDTEERITFMNPVAEALSGWKSEEVLHHPLSQVFRLINEQTGQAMEDPVACVLRECRIVPLANHSALVTKDGRIVPIEDSAAPILNAAGKIIGVALVFHDVTDKRRAEELLWSSEKRYRSLFSNMAEGFALHEIIADEKGRPIDYRFLDVNQAFEQLTGLKRADLVGHRVLEVMPGTEAYWIDHYGRVAMTGEPLHVENFSNELGRWYEVIAYQSAPMQFATIFKDTTERKQAEAHAQREHHETAFANRVLRTFVEYQDETLFEQALAVVQEEMASRHGVFGYISQPGHLMCPSLSKMLDACEIEGKCIHYPPEKWKGLWARALKEKRSLYTNQAPPVPPGHPIIHNNLATPILFHGEVIGLLNIANKSGGYTGADRDTLDRIAARIAPMLFAWIQRKLREDERTMAEEALRESEERFRLALRNAPVSVAAQDNDLKYIWAYNQKTAPPETIIGKSDYEIFTPEEAAHVTAMKRRVLEEDIILKDRMWFSRPSGPIFLEVCWEPLHDQTGRVTGVASATVDMTGLKKTEEEFKNLNEKLESMVQERTGIAQDRARQLHALAVELTEAEEQERRRIAQLLHDDLQQILAASKMQLETACRNLPHVPLIESVRQMLQESILKIRRLSHELSPAVLHQAGIVAALQWLASRMHEQFGLRVQFESDVETRISKSKFDSFIFRSVQELLFNINKHANIKNAIVRFSISSGSYVVTVLDKGKGFDTRLLNVFDPTAGFGLLTIKERINYIGGSLLIESEVGQGSCFTLTVPIIKHKPDDSNSSDASINHIEADLNTTKTGLRVLFVDDHKVIRNGLIKLMAGQPDIQVIGEASNGLEAIDAARQQRPDVIVMDISMPELDGIEATKIIKSEMPDIRVIGLTMHDDEHIIEQMLSAGAEATLNKSASTSQLLKTIYGRKDLRN